MWLALYLACSEQNLTPSETPSDPLPAPYLVEDTDAEQVTLVSLDEVATGVTYALTTVRSVDPNDIFEAQSAVYSQADSECPYVYDDYYAAYGYYYWYAACDSDSGASFDGYAFYVVNSDIDYGSYFLNDYSYFSGASDIWTTAGERYEQTGYAYLYDYQYPGSYRYTYWQVQGDFVWTGNTWSSSWLTGDHSADLYGYTYQYPDGSTLFYATGTLGGLVGTFNAVSMSDITALNAGMGSDCELEPGGSLSLRDTSGEWYDIEFHGPAYWGASTFPPDCDGCGDVYNRGTYLGEVCPDSSQLLSWTGTPWL